MPNPPSDAVKDGEKNGAGKIRFPSLSEGGVGVRRINLPHHSEGWELAKKELVIIAGGHVKKITDLESL
ncbi:unnamed protein product, partial [Discosporangium mesarthrocarpum]